MERRVSPLIPSWLECASCHFSLWAHWKIICVCLGFGLEVCWRSCPFQRCECTLPSKGSWSEPARLLWWVKPDPLNPAAAACSSLLRPDSARPALTTGPNTGQLSGRQLWFAFKQQQIPFSPAFFYLPVSSAHLFFLPPPPDSASCACCSAFLPINRKKTTRHVLNGPAGSEPAGRLSLGRLVIWWFCLGHVKGGGGDLEAFETTEGSCCVSFQAVHYNQAKYIKLNQCFLWNCLVSSY